jgi:hypothetical protein
MAYDLRGGGIPPEVVSLIGKKRVLREYKENTMRSAAIFFFIKGIPSEGEWCGLHYGLRVGLRY